MIHFRTVFSKTRGVVLLSLLSTLLVFLHIQQVYTETVLTYREAHPTSITLEKQFEAIEGRVVEVDLNKGQMVIKVDGYPMKLLLFVEDTEQLSDWLDSGFTSYLVKVNKNERQYRGTHNFYGFDYDRYLFSNGIYQKYKVNEIEPIPEASKSLESLCMLFKYRLEKRVSDERVRPYFKALVLGESDEMLLRDRYKEMGISHVFAISGLHFGLLYLMLKRLLKIPRLPKAVMTIGILSGYWLILGLPYSAGRALFLILYVEVAHFMGRKVDLISSVAVVNLVLLLLFPYAILSVSYHLSFMSYLAVAYFYKKGTYAPSFKCTSKILHLLLNKISGAMEAVRFALVIQLVLLPVQAYYFGQVNLISFLPNLILVPMISLLFPLLLLYLIVPIPFIGGYISAVEWMAVHLPIGQFQGNVLAQRQWPVFILLFVLLIIVDCFNFKRREVKRGLVLSMLAIMVVLNIHGKDAQVHFVDVGHGDAAWIKEGMETVLIDTGDGKTDIADLLYRNDVRFVSAVILSHAHADHIGGLESLLENMKVNSVYCNLETYEKVKKICGEDIQIIIVEKQMQLSNEDWTLTLLPFKSNDTNDNAIVVEYQSRDLSGYFLGDLSGSYFDEIPLRRDAYDFVKVAHHGSDTGANETFYTRGHFKNAIISHGDKYGLPDEPVIESVVRAGANCLTTYLKGEIILEGRDIKCFFE